MEGHPPDREREGDLALALARLAIPFAVGSALHLASLAGDRWWVGRVGTEALAALGTSHAILALLTTAALGIGMGALAGVARSTGEGRPARAARHATHGVYLAATFGAAAALAAWSLPGHALVGLDPRVRGPALDYLRIAMAGMLLQAPLVVLGFALQGAGEARVALRVASVAPIVNLALDPLLIHGAGLGVAGAAWATVASNALGLLAGALALRGLRERLPLGSALRLDRPVLARIVRIGAPGSLEHLVRSGAGLALVALLAPFGAAPIAGYTAALVVVTMLIFPGIALGQATATLVGQSLGAGRPDRAWRVLRLSVLVYGGFMTLSALVVHGHARALASLFARAPEAIDEGAALLRALSYALPGIAIALVVGKAFGGAGRTLVALGAAALAHLGVQVPLVYALSHRFGTAGAYAAMASAFVVHGTLSALLAARLLRPARTAVALTNDRRTARRLRPARIAVALVLLAALLSGCPSVHFTEKRHLSDPVMRFDDGPTETHFHQKVFYSREGSAGGIGSSAGGGCGCY